MKAKYSEKQCYSDIENILGRTLNQIEYETINQWFKNYDDIHILTCITLCKKKGSIFSIKYIANTIVQNYEYFITLYNLQEKEEENTIVDNNFTEDKSNDILNWLEELEN